MRTILRHGVAIEHVTPDEMRELLASREEPNRPVRIRAIENIILDANGNGQDEVYTVPLGYEFEARRIFLNLSTASGPITGAVTLNVAGKTISYLRSGTLIEYAIPLAPSAVAQVPGVQSWGYQEGPYLRNGEVFEVAALGLTAAATLLVELEGILSRPGIGR